MQRKNRRGNQKDMREISKLNRTRSGQIICIKNTDNLSELKYPIEILKIDRKNMGSDD